MKGEFSHGDRDSNHSGENSESSWPVAVTVSFVGDHCTQHLVGIQ